MKGKKTHKKNGADDIQRIETAAQHFIAHNERNKRRKDGKSLNITAYARERGVSRSMLVKCIKNGGEYPTDRRNTVNRSIPPQLEHTIADTLTRWSTLGGALPDDSSIRAFIFNLLQINKAVPTEWNGGVPHAWFARFKKRNAEFFATRKRKLETERQVCMIGEGGREGEDGRGQA